MQGVAVNGTIAITGNASSPDFGTNFGFLELVALDPGVITGDAIPIVPPDLSDLTTFDDLFPFPWLTSFGFDTTDAHIVRADISSLQLIPEPSTALLVSIGLVGLAVRRQRG